MIILRVSKSFWLGVKDMRNAGGALLGWVRVVVAGLLFVGAGFVAGCGNDNSSPSAGGGGGAPSPAPAPAVNTLTLTFLYGSEKQGWIEETTKAFNGAHHKTKEGSVIAVDAQPMGSGESIDHILDGSIHADLTSPASGAFITLGNAESRVKTNADLVPQTDNLVLSPVVIAMWKPMAEAIGWGSKPVGWADILSLAKNPQGWGAYGHPEWGKFKFGHTHPEYSNSGLISILAEVYAASGKAGNLTLDDVQKPETAQYVADIEQAIVHYGSSTGFFGKKMYGSGPSYLSAAVLYENMVIESYSAKDRDPNFPIVAIYPKEGTFWSDHPVGIVNRDWVTPERKEAAQVYINFLLDTPQQTRALAYGFRPANPSIALGDPIDDAHGVNPKEPQNVLAVPSADVMHAIIQLWHANKKHANVVLVMDCSGSMNDNAKMVNARAGADELVTMLDDQDHLSLLPFSTNYHWAGRDMVIGTDRKKATDTINGMIADGDTLLFDSIEVARKYLESHPDPTRISAIVVLTDGEDNHSRLKLNQLLTLLRGTSESGGIRTFTIGYGEDAQKDALKKIADETKAKYYDGKPENIREVFKDVATFF